MSKRFISTPRLARLTLSIPLLLATLTPGPADASYPQTSPDPQQITRVRDTRYVGSSFELQYDPTVDKVYVLSEIGPLELTDRIIEVCYRDATEIDVTFRIYSGTNWLTKIDTFYDLDSFSETLVAGYFGLSDYSFPAPTEDDLPTLDVFIAPNVSSLPTTPVVVIQPVPTCPDDNLGPNWMPVP